MVSDFLNTFFADLDPNDLRNEVHSLRQDLESRKRKVLQIAELTEISPDIGSNARLMIRKPDSNVVRLAIFGDDMYDTFGVHANLAGFNDAGTPKIWIDAQLGVLYAVDGVFSGTVTAPAGVIGGWTIGATSLSASGITLNSSTPAILMGAATNYMTGAGIFMGQHSSVYKFHIGNPAGNSLSWDGTYLAADGQWIRAAGLNPSLTEWSTNIVFSSASDTQVNWTSGTIAMQMSGLTYSIASGNTGTMSALTYIYLDLAVSLTVLQKTTTYSTAVGDGKILIAAAQNASGGGASVISYGGQQPIINGGAQITALSILAGNIAAGAITASKISVTNLQAVATTTGSLTVDGSITVSGSTGNLRFGSTPPTSATSGTGAWMDRDQLVFLNASVQNVKLAGATGLSILAVTASLTFAAEKSYKFVDSSGNPVSSFFSLNTGAVVHTEIRNDSQTAKTSYFYIKSQAPGGANDARLYLQSVVAGVVGAEIALFGTTTKYISITSDYTAIFGKTSFGTNIGMSAAGWLHADSSTAANTTEIMQRWSWSNNAWGLDLRQQHVGGSHIQWNFVDIAGNNLITFKNGLVGVRNTSPTSSLTLGTTGSINGELELQGSTSGAVVFRPKAAAGSWTFTIPDTGGTSGFQLQTNGSGVTSWAAAASLRQHKNIIGLHESPNDALAMIVSTPVYDFTYKKNMGTGDSTTIYTGIMADEAAWAMHHDGQIVNPVNTLGFMILGMRALNQRIEALEGKQ